MTTLIVNRNIENHIKISIKDINFYIINLEKDLEKKEFISKQMMDLGLKYQFVPGIEERRPIGIALSHLKILRNPDYALPFVILEDDVQFFEEQITDYLIVPANTDGIYLGHSHFGVREKDQYGLQWGKRNAVKYAIFDDQYIRIYAMLARHAILYISEKFRQATIKANEKALLNFDFPYPGDMAYAEIQKDHLLLSPLQPWCYQSELHRGNHPATKKSVLDTIDPMEEIQE